MVKKIILGIFLLPIVGMSQTSKFSLEFGGNYYKSDLTNNTLNQLSLIPSVSYFLNDKFSIGLQYQYKTNESTNSSSLQVYNTLIYLQSTTKQNNNYYGGLIRYYLFQNTSKFNAFLNLNPSIIKTDVNSTLIRIEKDLDNVTTSASQASLSQDIDAYDIDLGLSLSYKLISNLAIQLNLRSLMNYGNYKSNNSDFNSSTNNTTAIKIFDQPLKNTYISLNYQF